MSYGLSGSFDIFSGARSGSEQPRESKSEASWHGVIQYFVPVMPGMTHLKTRIFLLPPFLRVEVLHFFQRRNCFKLHLFVVQFVCISSFQIIIFVSKIESIMTTNSNHNQETSRNNNRNLHRRRGRRTQCSRCQQRRRARNMAECNVDYLDMVRRELDAVIRLAQDELRSLGEFLFAACAIEYIITTTHNNKTLLTK